jgi:hypothetical protein
MPAWESEPACLFSSARPELLSGASTRPIAALELYLFVWGALAWTVAIAVLMPLTFAVGPFAYRIWHGIRPIDDEMQQELWRRSAYCALFLFLNAWAFLLIDYVVATWMELPAGLVHLVVFLGLAAMLAWMMMICFALEDFFQGLSLLLVYLYLPVFVLWLPNWLIFGKDNPYLNWFYGWLATPT